MIRIRQGRVTGVKARRGDITEITVQIPGEPAGKAYNYDLLTGPVHTADRKSVV